MDDREIYLDYAATTPVDAAVAAEMATCLERDGDFANPSSAHGFGRAAARRVRAARQQIADRLGAPADSIVFTSGATESDNLAIRGALSARRDRGRHLITARTEHKAVLDTVAAMARQGWRVSYLGCDSDGLIDPAELAATITEETVLVSIMHVNNETGVVQDIEALGECCRRRDVLFHVDAAQSVGKLALRPADWPVDLVALTAHKVYGPKGIGALYVRPGVALAPILFGGEQERGLRPGTLAVHQIVGMGTAYAIADPSVEGPALRALKDRLWSRLAAIEGVRRNGHAQRSAPHILNVAFPGASGEALRLAIGSIAVSAGSACNAENLESSHVLTAMGRSDALAESSVRFSVGRYTSDEEIDLVGARVAAAVAHLRAMAAAAPRWCRS